MKRTLPSCTTLLLFLFACAIGMQAQPTWQRTSADAPSTISALIAGENGLVLAGVGGSGILRSTDGGASWAPANTGLTVNTVLTMTFGKNGAILIGTTNGVFRSTDNGSSWTAVNAGLPDETTIEVLVTAPNGKIYAGTDQGVFDSMNNGNLWQMAGLPTQIWAMTVDKNNYLYATSPIGGAFRSTNGGTDWVPIPLAAFGILDMEADPTTGYLFAVSSGVYRSSDQGISWGATSVEAGILTSMAVSRQGHVYITGDIGVLRSTNLGLTWEGAANGLNGATIMTLAAGPDGSIYGGTSDGRIYKTSGSSYAPDITIRSSTKLLNGSIPNPVTGAATIGFSLPQGDHITISIHDALGERVAVLDEGWRDAGDHTVAWDATAVPPGRYFCRLLGRNASDCGIITVVR